MPCYVDRAAWPFKRMTMCHLIADTEEELHAMATLIGMKRAWFQTNTRLPHYDLSKSKRTLAIYHGAIELDRQAFVQKMRELRGAPPPPS